MNLPERVDDLSFREHELLCTYITIYKSGSESRLKSKEVISSFIKEMQQDHHTAAAIKKWAYLVFKDDLSDEHSFEVMDGGEELYKVFFEYQIRLSQGKPYKAHEYLQTHVSRRGIGAINLRDHGANTQQCTRGTGRGGRGNQRSRRQHHKASSPKNNRRQAETAVKHSDAGDTAINSSLGRESSSATQQEPTFDTPPATGAEATKPNKRSASKKEKKRKARSQKPPVITASDASGDDKQSPETRLLAAANSVSHRSKRRIASNPCPQPHDLFGVNNQVDKINSAHKPQHPEDTGIRQRQSPLIGLGSEDIVAPPSIKGRQSAILPPSGRKHDRERVSNVTTQLTKASTNSRRLRKKGSARDLHTRANKRLRSSSMSTPDSEPGEVSKSTRDSRAKFLQESTIQGSPVIVPPLTQENISVASKARRKRNRVEFETGYVASDGNALADSHEFLGPDNRSLRPLPKKICDGRLAPVVDEDTAVSGVPCGTPSFEDADQLLRDAASNALAVPWEGLGPDVPDWTQEKEHDAECDDLGRHDQDEANDDQVTTADSAPSIVVPKPQLPAPPRIWAQSRQEVCESSEYFRSYHSGVYSKDDIVKGYLLGAYAASRDIFHHGGKLIISHGGGKSESILDCRRGHKRYQKDKDQEASDKSVRALLKTWKDRLPIALLADDKYALFPYDLASANYTYVVLGFYWISHAWAECQSARDGSGRIVRWKFAFQWCEGQGDPWWVRQPETTDMSSELPNPVSNSKTCLAKGSSHPANTGGDPCFRCENCQEQSPSVYKQGWMCLNPRCSVFWSIDGEEPEQLDYREEFLKLLPQTFERLPNITPARVPETTGGITTTYAFTKGFYCTECGRLSCRFKWEHWECSNCQFKHVVNGRLRFPKEFWSQRPSRGFLHAQLGKDSGILSGRPEPINLGAHKGFIMRLTYTLPHGRGKIHLIPGTPLANVDADNIFELYQRQASTGELKLRRYPLRNHRARGLLLTNYFSQNSGEPYQYVGGTGNTVPFHEAPDCVQRALALIKERSSLALRTGIPFNEVLSAAYMERQKMSFHSDSEKGLGPIVASLSLGSAALMHFRPHVNVETPSAKHKNTYALTLALRHGDVLIMEGDGVQKYYEHTVVPMNFRIAATARCIGSTL